MNRCFPRRFSEIFRKILPNSFSQENILLNIHENKVSELLIHYENDAPETYFPMTHDNVIKFHA